MTRSVCQGLGPKGLALEVLIPLQPVCSKETLGTDEQRFPPALTSLTGSGREANTQLISCCFHESKELLSGTPSDLKLASSRAAVQRTMTAASVIFLHRRAHLSPGALAVSATAQPGLLRTDEAHVTSCHPGQGRKAYPQVEGREAAPPPSHTAPPLPLPLTSLSPQGVVHGPGTPVAPGSLVALQHLRFIHTRTHRIRICIFNKAPR